jgi:hypothetical protein
MSQRFSIFAVNVACLSFIRSIAFAENEKNDISQLNHNDAVSEVIVVTGSLEETELLTLAGNIDRISR